MSGLGSVLNTALQSLMANQLGLSVASKNISNAQTPGYSRQRVDLAPSATDGVDVVGIEALRDKLMTARLNQETSNRSTQDTLQQALQDVQTWFNDPKGTGLLSELTDFFNAFQTLSVDPTSMTNRETVKQAAQSLCSAFQTQAANLSDQVTNANKAVVADVDKINSLTGRIVDLTQQIQSLEISGQPQNELRDQRSQLVQQLSQVTDVKEIESKGTYELVMGNGRMLVLNGDSQKMTTTLDSSGLYRVKAGSTDITSEIAGGDLKAQLQLRDQMIPAYQNQLDQFAYEITQHVNGIHSAAYTLDGNTNINFFAPLSSATGAASSISLSSSILSSTRNIAASEDGAAGDNAAAISIADLMHDPVFTKGSASDQYGALVYQIANDVSTATANFQEHDALATQLQNRIQSISGVSIDEEALQILQFQRSFQASAKLISAVDQMLQTVLGMVGQ